MVERGRFLKISTVFAAACWLCAVECPAAQPAAGSAGKVEMPGGISYVGHLQGACTDGTNIYWSMTYDLIKSDFAGRKIAAYSNRDFHMGDLCCRNGRIYVGINAGNRGGVRAGDMVWEFDAATLERIAVHPTPQTIWCNNGIEWYGGRFWIITNAPDHGCYNYVYEYTSDFRFVQCRPIASGWTYLGVQTICLWNDKMLFGCYGIGNDPVAPHRPCTFSVDVKDLSRPSRNAECPYVVNVEKRFPSNTAEGFFALDGHMWIAHGTVRYIEPQDASKGSRKRLFGAWASPAPGFERAYSEAVSPAAAGQLIGL